MKFDKEKFKSLSDEKKMGLIKLELSLKTHNATTRADLLMLLDWLYRKAEKDTDLTEEGKPRI